MSGIGMVEKGGPNECTTPDGPKIRSATSTFERWFVDRTLLTLDMLR